MEINLNGVVYNTENIEQIDSNPVYAEFSPELMAKLRAEGDYKTKQKEIVGHEYFVTISKHKIEIREWQYQLIRKILKIKD
jgi:hypothetical protein